MRLLTNYPTTCLKGISRLLRITKPALVGRDELLKAETNVLLNRSAVRLWRSNFINIVISCLESVVLARLRWERQTDNLCVYKLLYSIIIL